MKKTVSPGLVLSGVVGASELAFIQEPSDVIAVRDRPLMLDCQVEGEGPISITWRRNGVPVAIGVRATVLGNGTLLIRNFSKRRESNETDAGEYDCAAQNHYGMLISRKARVLLACESCDTHAHLYTSILVRIFIDIMTLTLALT